MSDSSSLKTGIFCDICGLLSVTSLDHESKLETGACRSCNLKFIQPNRKKWEDGWRPTQEEINKFKAVAEKSVYSILSDINSYI